MGIFSGVKKAFGKVVGGVVKFIDKVTGIDLGKILDNKWVKGALMAASIFTGGVSIINGVMTGVQKFGESAATSFLGKFVEGASGFISGVAKGLSSPLDTAGELIGKGQAALNPAGNVVSTDAMPLDEIAPKALTADSGRAMDALSMAGDAVGQGAIGGASVGGQSPASAMSGFEAPQIQDFGGMGQEQTLASSVNSAFSKGGDALSNAVQGNEKGWLEMLKAGDVAGVASRAGSGIMDFAKTPFGAQTIVGGVQGWAQGQAIEERYKRALAEEEKRRRSWDGFSGNAPTSFNVPALRDLRERTRQANMRGNQAQAKFG